MTEPTQLDTPVAATLDDATLRELFPAAPADLTVPRDVSGLFRARMRSFGGSNRTIMLIGWAALLVIGIVLAVAGSLGLGITLVVIALVAAIGVAWHQHNAAASDFFDRYAEARGLTHAAGGGMRGNVPLFSRGDRRKFARVMSGTIAGQDAQFGHYTYTEVSRDSDGDETSTDYDFTVLRFDLPPAVAQRFAGVNLSPKQLSFGALQDKLSNDHKVELESIAFTKRYSLRALDSQDEIALYELFSTTFVEQLATTIQIYWEQRSGDLVFWKRGHENEAADLDMMCKEAAVVLQRYREEDR